MSQKVQSHYRGLRYSVSLSSLMVPVLLMVASGIIITYLIFSVQNYFQLQTVVDIASQQRVLNQKYTKNVLLAAEGLPSNYEKIAVQLKGALRSLINGGDARLSSGDMAPIPSTKDPEIKKQLERQEKLFTEIESLSQKHLDSNDNEAARSEVLIELYQASLELQDAADQSIMAYDKHIESGVKWWKIDAVAIEVAERHKTLIQQHIKDILFVANGIATDYQESRIKLFNSLKLLIEGGPVNITDTETVNLEPPKTADIQFTLENQKRILEKFTALSNGYLMLSNVDIERSLQLKRLSDLTSQFHGISTTTWQMFKTYYQTRLGIAMQEVVLAGALFALFAFLLAWYFASSKLIRPLIAVQNAVNRLGRGDTDVFISRFQNNEIGDVALAINKAANSIKAKFGFMDKFVRSEFRESPPTANENDQMSLSMRGWSEQFQQKLEEEAERRQSAVESMSRISTKTDLDAMKIVGKAPNFQGDFKAEDILEGLIQRATELETQEKHLKVLEQKLQNRVGGAPEWNSLLQESQSVESDEDLKRKAESLQESEQKLKDEQKELYNIIQNLTDQTKKQRDEIHLLASRKDAKVESLKTELSLKESEIETLKADKEAGGAQVQKFDSDNEELRTMLFEARRDAASQLSRFKASVGEKDAIISSQADEMNRLEEKLKDLRLDFKDKTEFRDTELINLRNQLEEKKLALNQAESARERLNALQESMTSVRKELEEKTAVLNSIQTQNHQQSQEMSALKEAKTVLEDKLLSSQQDLDHKLNELARIEAEYNDKKQQFVQNHEIIEEQAKTLTEYREKVDKASHETRQLQERYEATRTSMTQAQAQLETRNAEIAQVRNQMMANELELRQTRERMEGITSELRVQKDAAQETGVKYQKALDDLAISQSYANKRNDELARKTNEYDLLNQKQQVTQQRISQMEETLKKKMLESHELQEKIQTTTSELMACREAYEKKSEAFNSAVARLKSTRDALRSSIDELRERD